MKWKFWEKEIPKEEPKPQVPTEPKASFLLTTDINSMGLASVERIHRSDGEYFTEIKVRSTQDPTKASDWKFYISYEQHERCIQKILADTSIKCIVV